MPFEVYIIKVERQLERNVKIIRSNRGDEYYDKYDKSGQCPGPFAKLLEKVAFVHNTLCQERHLCKIHYARNTITKWCS